MRAPPGASRTAGRGAVMVAVGILHFGGPGGLDGQAACIEPRSARVAPALLQDDEGKRALGLGFSAHACRISDDVRPRFPRSRWVGGGVEGVVPLRSLGLPQQVDAGVEIGLSVALSERRPLDLDDDPDADLFRFDYGFAAVGARIGYEASTDFDEQAVLGGAELRWTDPRRPLLPSVVLTGGVVQPTGSKARDALGLDRDVHGRLGIRGYWLIPLPAGFRVELDGTYFRAFGLDEVLEAAGWDRGPYASVELARGMHRTVGRLVVESLFVGYARGQRPTGFDVRQAWLVGVELGFERR